MIPGNFLDRRFLAALGLSLLLHFLLMGSWGEGVGGAVLPQPLLQARLESPPLVAETPAPAAVPVPATVPVQPGESGVRKTRNPAVLPVAGAPGSGANGTDSRFYLARELDYYPEALDWPELRQAATVAHVRIWVGIDQQGRVVDVAPAEPGHPVAGIRERLLAIRFVPARKDGRPVKSRVLMEWAER